MHTLWVFAISIDTVRGIFRADDALAERLRNVAAADFPPPGAPERRGLFHKLGPLLRRQPADRIDPDSPTPADMHAVLVGGYIAPQRLYPSWRLFISWLKELSQAYRRLEIADLDGLEFNLALAGLSSQYALRHLAHRQLGTPLKPLGNQLAGYSKHFHVVETKRALDEVEATLEGKPADVLAQVSGVREILSVAADSPGLDVVVVEEPPEL